MLLEGRSNTHVQASEGGVNAKMCATWVMGMMTTVVPVDEVKRFSDGGEDLPHMYTVGMRMYTEARGKNNVRIIDPSEVEGHEEVDGLVTLSNAIVKEGPHQCHR